MVEKMRDLPRCDLIKIDVEGAELAVLHGAKQTLSRFKPLILMELSVETAEAADHSIQDIIDFLVNRGYQLYSLKKNGSIAPYAPLAFQNIVAIPIG